VGSTGDTITVRIVAGVLTALDVLLYVERHGLFEVARREEWPTPEGTPRTYLMLRAWPQRW
jgi:hypothetical protein